MTADTEAKMGAAAAAEAAIAGPWLAIRLATSVRSSEMLLYRIGTLFAVR